MNMNIVLTFDNSYTNHAAVVITSLCLNNAGNHHFYVITDYISNENKEVLLNLVISFKSKLTIYNINISLLKDFPIGKGTTNTYVTLATYYRLFIIDVLPVEVNRVLYLDCDIVVNGSLDELWNFKFSSEENCIAGVEEQHVIAKNRSKALGYQEIYSYFNAGVLLIELEKMRKIYSSQKSIAFIKQNIDIIKFHDQDVLNAFFYDKKDFLPLTFNLLDIFLLRKSTIPSRYRNNLTTLKNPIIIHYSGPLKPWHKECKHPLKYLYYKYLSYTIWKDFRPSYKEKSIFKRYLYYIKSFIARILFKKISIKTL